MVDTVVIKSETPAEDQAHIDAMVKKADEAATAGQPDPATEGAPEAATEQRPEWLPEKFKSPEDLAKAYAELEAKQGGKKDEATTETPDPANASQAEAEKVLSDKGLDFNEFSKEFAEKGELSAESYEKLEKSGLPKAVIDSYIAGQQALATQFTADVQAVTGGAEGFAQMAAWAQANASKEELKAYNEAIDSGDAARAKLAAAGLYQKFLAAGHGDEPNLVTSKGGPVTVDKYESLAQLKKDMASTDYKTDPAFRKKVQDKLARSDIL